MKKLRKKMVTSKMVSDAFGRVDDDRAARRDAQKNLTALIDIYSRASRKIRMRFFSEAARLGIIFVMPDPGDMVISSIELTRDGFFESIPPKSFGPLFDSLDGRPSDRCFR